MLTLIFIYSVVITFIAFALYGNSYGLYEKIRRYEMYEEIKDVSKDKR